MSATLKRAARWAWPTSPQRAMTVRDALAHLLNSTILVGGSTIVAVMLSYHVQSQDPPCRIGINCEAGQYLEYQEHP